MVVGVTLVKDEADVIRWVIEHMLTQVDHVIAADNGSTDDTRVILDLLASTFPVTVVDDPEVGYYQARRTTALARQAADMGAEWVVPFDADEFWVAREGTVKQALEALDPEVAIAAAHLLNHVSTDADPADPDPRVRMGWRLAEIGAMPKVAVRPRLDVMIEQGNHRARYPDRTAEGLFAIHHYPYRSAVQTIRKARNGAAAYAAAPDLPDDLGAHWRQHGQMSDEQLAGVFADWWHFADPASDPRLVYDPPPVCAA